MKTRSDRSGLACRESIAHLWNQPGARFGKRPSTTCLFSAIVDEALACLYRSDWEVRIRRIENILSVIKWRINRHREEWLDLELEKLAEQKKEVKEA